LRSSNSRKNSSPTAPVAPTTATLIPGIAILLRYKHNRRGNPRRLSNGLSADYAGCFFIGFLVSRVAIASPKAGGM
jgi:hypothetical protein